MAAAAADHGSGIVVEVDYNLKLGDMQHMEFSSNADLLPQIYALNAACDDCARLDKKGKEVTNKKDEVVVVEGWSGKEKVLKKVFWERILWKYRMVLKVKPDDERCQDMCMQTTLHKCPDFNFDIGATTKLIQDEKHICLFCAKGHPDIAGLGIEYDWVVSNKIFRSKNYQVDSHMQGFLNEALNAIMLTITIRTARRVRLYMRAYKTGMLHLHDLIKKFVKIHKCHQNILDQETKYLEKLVVLYQGAEVNLELLKREAETGGLKIYGADGVRLQLHQAAAVTTGLSMYGADGIFLPLTQATAFTAAAAVDLDYAPDTEDSGSNSDTDSIVGDLEISSERAKS